MYELILKDFKLNDKDILDCFPYGSRVYGTASSKSDYDFILVMNKVETDSDKLDSKNNYISITTYLKDSFQNQINMHKIGALECLFAPKDKILKRTSDLQFKLNKSILRKSISEKCSKDWGQASKRFSNSQEINPITGERYVRKIYEGKKSLFHCFRMINFATQIINFNKINDFTACNDLWEEIYTNPSENWEDYKSQYHKKFNFEMSEFRKICPKN